MRRYDDPFIHFAVAVLFVIGFFAVFSGFTLPRLAYLSVYHPDSTGEMLRTFRPLLFSLIIAGAGGLVYLFLSKGVRIKRVFGWRVKEKGVVYGITALTLFLMAVVVAEKFVFGLRANRWLLGPKHMILITGLTITAAFLFLSYQLSRERIDWKTTLGVFFLFLILLVAQPDFGTGALLVGALLLLVFVIVQNKWVKRIYITLFSLILGVIVFSIVNAGLKVELPAAKGAFWGHVVVRINNWLNPFHDVTDRSYQIANSLYAVHKGGFDGVGYGFGTRKLYMGATVHTDFIFATIGEELGFIFATFIIVTSALLVFRLLEISYRFQSKFEKFFTLLVAFETFAMVVMNAGMAVNFLPSKGWPYPLISYGPFFVVFYIIQLGIVQYFLNRRFYEVYAPKKVKKVQRTRAVV